MRKTNYRKYSDEEIIQAVIEFYREYGDTASEYRYKKEKRKPYPSTIYNRFGKWSETLKKAGIEKINEKNKKLEISDDEIIKILNEANDAISGKLTIRKYKEWAKFNHKVSGDTIKRRLGGWTNALKKANIK